MNAGFIATLVDPVSEARWYCRPSFDVGVYRLTLQEESAATFPTEADAMAAMLDALSGGVTDAIGKAIEIRPIGAGRR